MHRILQSQNKPKSQERDSHSKLGSQGSAFANYNFHKASREALRAELNRKERREKASSQKNSFKDVKFNPGNGECMLEYRMQIQKINSPELSFFNHSMYSPMILQIQGSVHSDINCQRAASAFELEGARNFTVEEMKRGRRKNLPGASHQAGPQGQSKSSEEVRKIPPLSITPSSQQSHESLFDATK